MLKKGDPCYVRLYSGEIVKAKYWRQDALIIKGHWVRHDKKTFFVTPGRTPESDGECRFVCMTGLNNAQQQSPGLKVKER